MAQMAKDQNHVRAHLTICGRVQGVYFRASTVYEAQNLGLTGWVRNCPDGSVEAVAEGDRNKVEEWIAWCGRGPSGARVERVEVRWLAYNGEFQAFQIKR
jgi:acylphosphatase